MNSVRQNTNHNKKNQGKIELIFILGILLGILIIILIALKGISGFRAAHKSADTTICINNLKTIGKAVESYKDKNAGYPETLDDLVKQNFIESISKCPETNKDYIYSINKSTDSESFEICCPDPYEHIRRGRIKYKDIKYIQGKGIVLIEDN